MKSYESWEGTKSERNFVLDFCLVSLREEYFPELSKKDFNRLFLEAFSRNLVQNELKEMMAYILDEE